MEDYKLVLSILWYVIACLVVGSTGYSRRMGFWGMFIASLLFSPILGVLLSLTSNRLDEDELEVKDKKYPFFNTTTENGEEPLNKTT